MNKEEILLKVEEIANYIKETEEYKKYLKSLDNLNKNQELLSIIENIKKYQQEIVKDKNKEEELDKKIKKNLDILNNNPIYLEYLNYQDEVNNMIIIFENKLNKYFSDIFN